MARSALFGFVVVLTTSRAGPLVAWNDTGHMLIALIAYELLDEETRAKALDILRRHERFEADFAKRMPEELRAGAPALKERWVFVHAATWPALVREFEGADRKRYHHSSWHYINQPLFADPKDARARDRDVPVNLGRKWRAGMKAGDMNALQAMEKCRRRLTSDRTRKTEKAEYLCWLLHLVGDLHQPLHVTTLFSERRFRDGDRGGNAIPVEGAENLHELWDAIFGEERSLGFLEERVRRLGAGEQAIPSRQRALRVMDFDAWLREGYTAAVTHAYSDVVLAAVAAGEEHPEEDLEPIALPTEYVEAARELSGERILAAGCRLAKILETVLK